MNGETGGERARGISSYWSNQKTPQEGGPLRAFLIKAACRLFGNENMLPFIRFNLAGNEGKCRVVSVSIAAILLPPLTPNWRGVLRNLRKQKTAAFYFQKPPNNNLERRKILPFQRLFFICRRAIL